MAHASVVVMDRRDVEVSYRVPRERRVGSCRRRRRRLDLRSVRTWLPGHGPPRLAIEVVSETNPHKDYVIAPDK